MSFSSRRPGVGNLADSPSGEAPLRMLRGAREAATGMRISDEQLRGVFEDPDSVEHDASRPGRVVLARRGVEVTVGDDGTIVRVRRHKR